MSRLFLLWVIRSYWNLVPVHRRRECLFRVTCSQFVYKALLENGIREGWEALKTRNRRCRPGYQVLHSQGKFLVRFADGGEASEEEIAEHVLLPFRQNLNEMEAIAIERTLAKNM